MSKYSEDIEFVLSEMVRHSRMDVSALRALSLEDHLSTFPHPSGNGHLICGLIAERRLSETVDYAVQRSKFRGRLDRKSVLRNLKKEIIERFVKNRASLTPQEAQHTMNAAIKSAASLAFDSTHFIPCHLVHGSTTELFSIGPVTFTKTPIALAKIETSLQTFAKQDEKDAKSEQSITEGLASDARAYYGAFGWIAEVKVLGCDAETSAKRARATVQSALDCLHLLIGAGHSSKMRMGGPNYMTDRRSTIVMRNDGAIDLSTQLQSEGNHLIDEWWETINRKGADKLIDLMDIAIRNGHLEATPTPLSQRFLDASAWYGQAVRDRHPASQLVKYATAIERIVTTKNEEFLAETIAARGASILCAGGVEKFDNFARIKRVYNMRSELVHGSRSPNNLRFGGTLHDAEELARNILLSSLHFFGGEGLQSQKQTFNMLDQQYVDLVKWANDQRARGQTYIAAQLNFGA